MFTKILSAIVCVWLFEYSPSRYLIYAFAAGAATFGIIDFIVMLLR